jgi:mono/diheme cytochrome c family protein
MVVRGVVSVLTGSVMAALIFFGASAPANGQGITTAQGAYTETQALRGLTLFRENCVQCHGPEMDGAGFFIPAIGGREFARYWKGRPIYDVFAYVKEFMPFDQPGSLDPQTYVDIIAYILQFTGYPPGDVELPVGRDALKLVRVVALP